MMEAHTRRLVAGDAAMARSLFRLMAEVFEEENEPLSDNYVEQLLSRPDFWVYAAFVGEDIVGGITAHTLPMTRSEAAEIFIYDIAVRPNQQRKGIGRRLIGALREDAAAAGIEDLFVPADDEDTHALEFYRALGGAPSPVTFFNFSAGG